MPFYPVLQKCTQQALSNIGDQAPLLGAYQGPGVTRLPGLYVKKTLFELALTVSEILAVEVFDLEKVGKGHDAYLLQWLHPWQI